MCVECGLCLGSLRIQCMRRSYATQTSPIKSYGVRFNECIGSLPRSVDNRAWLPHRCAPLRAPLRRTTVDGSQRLSKAKQSEELSAHCIAPHGVHPVHRCSQTSNQILLAIDIVSSGRAGQVSRYLNLGKRSHTL